MRQPSHSVSSTERRQNQSLVLEYDVYVYGWAEAVCSPSVQSGSRVPVFRPLEQLRYQNVPEVMMFFWSV